VVVLVALPLCAYAAAGCAAPCREDDPDRQAAFQGAWRGDITAIRALIAKNPAAANTSQCPPDYSLIGRFIASRVGAGTPTVLHIAARQGHADFATVLLEAGANVDARDFEANTPLHLAAQYGHDEVARLLLAANATVDVRRLGGLTPLHVAAGRGHFPVVKRLLVARADVNAREGGNWTPLHRAASEGHENVVRLLLDQGGDPRAVDDQGAAPLQYAVLNRHRAVIELLTARGVAASGESSGPRALALAARDGDPESVRFLLGKACPWTPAKMARRRCSRPSIPGPAETIRRGGRRRSEKNARW
jgi:ankyrin repeat protein